jgi:hypothetical protein
MPSGRWLAHHAQKWIPVLRKSDATTKNRNGKAIPYERAPLQHPAPAPVDLTQQIPLYCHKAYDGRA